MNGADRYNQAILKARLIAQRELRQFIAGEIDVLSCSMDREREFIIAELDRVIAQVS